MASQAACSGASDADLVVVTRRGCHLCEQAEPLARQLAADHGATFALLDVDDDPAVQQQWTAHVPVVFVRGELVCYWFLDVERVEAALRGTPLAPPPALDP